MSDSKFCSPHFPTYFDNPLENDTMIARELWAIRGSMTRMRSFGMSDSVVNQSLRALIGSFWDARAVRYRVQHEYRPWSRAAKLASSKSPKAPGEKLTYEHPVPINILAKALLDTYCDDFENFRRLLTTLSLPCMITKLEDDRLTKEKSNGRCLRDCMPQEFTDVPPWEWALSALDARYRLAGISFDIGEWPSEAMKRILKRRGF